MAARLSDRLAALHQARDAQMAAGAGIGTALVVAKHRQVEAAFRDQHIRLVSAGGSGRRIDAAAFRQGQQAGDHVTLDQSGPPRRTRPTGLSTDIQRSRLYSWEDRVVAPLDPSTVAVRRRRKALVDAIWAELDLRFPADRSKKCRRRRRAASPTPTACASACPPPRRPGACCTNWPTPCPATTPAASDGHGPRFVGLYVQLLVRYLRLDRETLLASLAEAGIVVAPDALPAFIDRP